jgi:hypothetical protein
LVLFEKIFTFVGITLEEEESKEKANLKIIKDNLKNL